MKAATSIRLKHLQYIIGFQSTPPVKAATVQSGFTPAELNISIHAAREGGDDLQLGIITFVVISIHAAREGGDNADVTLWAVYAHFNPRRP